MEGKIPKEDPCVSIKKKVRGGNKMALQVSFQEKRRRGEGEKRRREEKRKRREEKREEKRKGREEKRREENEGRGLA